MESAAYNSMKGKIAFGENAGSFVTRLGMGFGYAEEVPKFKSKLCYSLHGFSIHAATRVNTHRREKLAKLVRYMSRGAISNKRIKIITEPSGHKWVRLKLKTPYSDGTTHLRFSFSEFIEKLVAITPAPRSHLVRWGGVFASASPYRKKIVLRPEVGKGFKFEVEASSEIDKENLIESFKKSSWARLLSKVFGVDVLKCDCGSELKPVSAILKGDEIKRYLRHLGLDADPPEPEEMETEEKSVTFSLFEAASYEEEEFPVINHD